MYLYHTDSCLKCVFEESRLCMIVNKLDNCPAELPTPLLGVGPPHPNGLFHLNGPFIDILPYNSITTMEDDYLAIERCV